MIDRLLMTAGVLLASGAAYLLLRVYLALRTRAVLSAQAATPDSLAASLGNGDRATLVYFSTAECGRCRDQARAVDALSTSFGERVRVKKVDALSESDLAARYGVLTVPTTVVLDGAARPRAINYGFAPASKLDAQLRAALDGFRTAEPRGLAPIPVSLIDTSSHLLDDEGGGREA